MHSSISRIPTSISTSTSIWERQVPHSNVMMQHSLVPTIRSPLLLPFHHISTPIHFLPLLILTIHFGACLLPVPKQQKKIGSRYVNVFQNIPRVFSPPPIFSISEKETESSGPFLLPACPKSPYIEDEALTAKAWTCRVLELEAWASISARVILSKVPFQASPVFRRDN